MSELNQDADLRKAIRQATRRMQQKSQAERQMLIQQAIEQAMSEELAEERAQIEREAEEVREQLTRDSRGEEAARARRNAPTNLLLLLLLLLILLLIAAATGRLPGIISFPALNPQPTPFPATIPSGGADTQLDGASSRSLNNGAVPPIGSAPQEFFPVGDRFLAFYNQNGGERIFGRAISQPMQVNGRSLQWFERARLEEWPEMNGTPYTVQSGRLGVEYTRHLTFATEPYFVSVPGQRYFRETGYGVAEPFLSFWERNGGLTTFGYPISGALNERLPDGEVHRVQYFERVRIELHERLRGTPHEIQVGLLGNALHLFASAPEIIPTVAAPPATSP